MNTLKLAQQNHEMIEKNRCAAVIICVRFSSNRGQKALVLRTLILSLKLPGWTQIQNKTNINWF